MTTHTPLRLAIAQTRMHWNGDDNTATTLAALAQAAARGAAMCVFAELTLTGIHRQIVAQAQPARVAAWMHAVAAACAQHRIAAAVGAPVFRTDGEGLGAIHIAHHFCNAEGQWIGHIEKQGLTGAEATFFQPGRDRSVITLLDRRFSAVICREIDDADTLVPQWAALQPDILLWPGAMRPDPALPLPPPGAPMRHVEQAQQLARDSGAIVIQANWPNALNRPEEGEHAGQSVCIAADGTILLSLPRAAAGVAVFTLADKHFTDFEWHAETPDATNTTPAPASPTAPKAPKA